ncbi:MAG: hypothetical protein AABY84_06345 [Candidatus Firestonebacteria bacterium]
MKRTTSQFIEILATIKTEFERCITKKTFNGKKYKNGNEAKNAYIRSQRLICLVHEFIKQQLIDLSIDPKKIFPPIGANKPEINIEGLLKKKNQDICILPRALTDEKVQLKDEPFIDSGIVINIRSQLSSLNKNFDTLYERTFAEPLNLHLKFPKLCMGEVYLIPTHEYNDKAMFKNRIDFKSVSKLGKYIQAFQAVNNRGNSGKDPYRYERVCLAIVDFRQSPPKLYSNNEALVEDGLISRELSANMEKLGIDDFVKDLLDIYGERFNLNLLR